jgi:hypothetical protein
MSSAVHIKGEFDDNSVQEFFKKNKIEYSPMTVGGNTYYQNETEVAWPDKIYGGISFSTYFDGDLNSVAKISKRFYNKFGGKLTYDLEFTPYMGGKGETIGDD